MSTVAGPSLPSTSMIDSAFGVGASAATDTWGPEPPVSTAGIRVLADAKLVPRKSPATSDKPAASVRAAAARRWVEVIGVLMVFVLSVIGLGRIPFPDRTPMLRLGRRHRCLAQHTAPVFRGTGGKRDTASGMGAVC